ncbi:MAG: VIT domain-containing protein [Candidatus Methylomirabilales bacterium]
MKKLNVSLLAVFIVAFVVGGTASGQAKGDRPKVDPIEQEVTQGALRVKTVDGVVEIPLRHTDVQAEISGFIARVKVTQTFFNPYDEKIEAVYVFPLPHTAAVDDMTMVIGDHRIVGVVKRRAEARAIYEQALMQGLTASLLEQERPNIFTQSVGNIKPHQEIVIEISYVDVLKYDMGMYDFHFPMVVGPRYIPGAPISKKPDLPDELKGKVGTVKGPTEGPDAKGTGWSPDTDRVKDASRITPPVLKPGYRTGHDISLSVRLDAGVPIQDIKIVNHQASLDRINESRAVATLSPADSVPNKDFAMKYAVVGEKPEMALLAHSKGPGQGYFLLMIQPKIDEHLAKAPPREIVFLIDVSGSMSGAPTKKVQEAMQQFFKLSKSDDTIQVVTFASRATKLFREPVPATAENVSRALNFTEGIRGGGGTEMLKGIKMVLNEPLDPERVRIVVMLTDGFIGNEAQIIEEVGRRAGDRIRFWVLGIGSSPNRFLLDGVAKVGGGMSAVIELRTDPTELVTQIVERIHRAQLAEIQIDWNGLSVFETYPRKIPELWAGRPVILFGRYGNGGSTTIELSGLAEGEPISYALDVTLPSEEREHGVLSKVWARNKIADLSSQMFYGDTPEVVEEITQIALDYRLLTQYTSFVAVDESEVPPIGEELTPPRRVVIPVPLPEGVSFEGIFGPLGEEESIAQDRLDHPMSYKAMPTLRRKGYRTAIQHRGRGQLNAPAAQSARKMATGTSYQMRREAAASSFAGGGGLFSMGEAKNVQRFASPKEAQLEDRDLSRRMAAPLFGNWAQMRHEEAKKALAEAQELHKKGKLELALLRFQHALVLETGFLSVSPWSDDGTAAAAAGAIRRLMKEIAKNRAQRTPGLARKLDLVIRNQAIQDAMHTIGKATGFKVEFLPGSLADAAEMLNVPELRVTYLDLRRATVAQALDRLLTPAHLAWRIDKKNTITVGTSRRLPGTSAWVYLVGDLSIPSQKEMGNTVRKEMLAKSLTEFLKGIRIVINQKGESGLSPGSAVLIDPAYLLVYGDKEIHTRVAAFLIALRNPKGDLTNIRGFKPSHRQLQTLRRLQREVSVRWNVRAEARKMRLEAYRRLHTLTALDNFSWQLLASAYRGRVDDEAMIELDVAWESPSITKIVEGPNNWITMRSAWIISEAARTHPKNRRLRMLAEKVLSVVKKQVAPAIKTLKKRADGPGPYLSALYSVLSLENGKVLNADIDKNVAATLVDAKRLLAKQISSSRLATARVLGAALLAPSPQTDTALLEALSAHQIQGDDLVTLAAIAARHRGGKVWGTFREELPYIVGGQPLNGHVILIVNRLATLRVALR